MPQRTSVHTGRLTIPLPESCSDDFAAGWSLADMHAAVPPLPSFPLKTGRTRNRLGTRHAWLLRPLLRAMR